LTSALPANLNGNGGPQPQLDRPRCLIVDDEPRLRQALMRLMQSEGFLCSEAGSGFQALEILEREPVALVLSDLRMPGMDGATLLTHVRSRFPDTAMVMITAVAEVQVAVDCLARGAMDYITKPFVLEEVRARAAQALEKRQLMKENRDYHELLEKRVPEQAQR
jgi:DNA-binding NtrC family response regulator